MPLPLPRSDLEVPTPEPPGATPFRFLRGCPSYQGPALFPSQSDLFSPYFAGRCVIAHFFPKSESDVSGPISNQTNQTSTRPISDQTSASSVADKVCLKTKTNNV